jgi:hypothetical protein
MAKEVQINIDVKTNAGESEKSLGDLNKEMKTTLKTLDDMEEASGLLSKALREQDLTTKEGRKNYEKLRKELIKVNTEIKNQELAMEALDNEQVASEMKSVAGGLTDMAGGFALVGVAGKEMEEVVQTMAKVEGATKIVTGAIEGYSSIMKLSGTITTAFTAATAALGKSQILMAVKTKIVTAAQWLWNAAITANPIGLIIVGISALIAGIVLLIANFKKIIKSTKAVGVVLLALLGPIGLVIGAFVLLGKTQETEAEKEAKREKERRKQYDKRIKALEKIVEAEKKAGAEREKLHQDEVDRLESLGLATNEARLKLLQGKLNDVKKIAGSEKKLSTETIAEYNRRMKTSFKTEEEITKHFKKSTEERIGVLWAADEEEIEIINSRVTNNKAAAEELRIAENNLNKFYTENNSKRVDEWKKAAEERLRIEQELISRSTAAWEKYDELQIERMEEGVDKRLAIAQQEFENNIKGLDDNLQAEAELIKAYEEKLQLEIWQIKKDAALEGYLEIEKLEKKRTDKTIQESSIAEEKIQQSKLQIYMKYAEFMVSDWQQKNAETIQKVADAVMIASAAISGALDIAQQVLNMQSEAASEKRQEQYESDSEALKASLANREISQQQYEDKLALLEKEKAIKERQAKRKAFEQNKAFQIVNAIMNTAQAVVAGLAAPFPIGIVMGALNAAMGAAQIGVIASQKFKAAKGGVVPGAPSSVDSVDALLAPGEMVINSQSASMFPQTLSQINQAGGGVSLAPQIAATSGTNTTYRENEQQTVKAYVVETEITDKQKKVSRIERAAQF